MLRSQRDSIGFTRQQVARAIQESENKLYKWEKGVNRPEVLAMLKLMALYELPAADILSFMQEPFAVLDGQGGVMVLNPTVGTGEVTPAQKAAEAGAEVARRGAPRR